MPDEMNEILQRLTRVETKLDLMLNARDIALEALQSTRSAHKRLDDMKQSQRWLIGISISSASVAIAALGFLWKVAIG